jgi:hypothetical protein
MRRAFHSVANPSRAKEYFFAITGELNESDFFQRLAEVEKNQFHIQIKVALYSWLFALGSGAGVGMRGSISARVAAL